ncbi:3-oxoacyl-ACP synthase III family protein [Chondrinema litorale]|uniref:3-oxoacyl-ACP synthase III family protein n=1 Tax=Chondrinema litorale TaxID=2994555 RepID=UPI0025429C4D|nr:ketoacyl-ACP synthase III [Chondrinema litorale]UZR97899.1 ketoacyl-ACP synthase III [Chondrinema litorale]
MRKALIRSTGAYVPEWSVPNSYFNELLNEDVDTWLQENLSIKNRHWCNPAESTADLAEAAAWDALRKADLRPEKLDLIIIATDTPEFISPSTASVIQDRLRAKNAGTFDLNTACAGFVTALDVAAKYITADDRYNNVLVVGAYAMSKHLNKQDKKTVTLFADGAGAVLLSAEENTNRGFLASELRTEGQYNSWMGVYAGGTNQPITEQVIQAKDHQLKFVHRFPKELNPEVWTDMIRSLCERIDVSPAQVAQYFITQLNINSIQETMEVFDLPMTKAHTIMQNNGYTGSACIPMALDDAINKGKLKEGDLIFLIGSGGGLAFAATAFRY